MTPRRLLQESDELLFWVEECLVQEIQIVPGWLVARLTVVLRHAHSERPFGQYHPVKYRRCGHKCQSKNIR